MFFLFFNFNFKNISSHPRPTGAHNWAQPTAWCCCRNNFLGRKCFTASHCGLGVEANETAAKQPAGNAASGEHSKSIGGPFLHWIANRHCAGGEASKNSIFEGLHFLDFFYDF